MFSVVKQLRGQNKAGKAEWRNVAGTSSNDSTESVIRAFASNDPAQVLHDLQTSQTDGLTDAEASSRLSNSGSNVVSSKKPPSWWLLLLMVIPNPFNILLGFIAIISVASPDRSWETFAVLTAMIVISSGLRFWQEWKSTVSVVKLQNSVTTNVKVLRRTSQRQDAAKNSKGVIQEIPEKRVVVGDIIHLTPGDSVAADCLILESNYLRISQSSLTGESMPVTKAPATPEDEKSRDSLFDLPNIAFMGTNVVSGSAVAVVLRTGDGNFIASIMKQLSKKREPNTFQRGIRNVSYMLIGFMLVMVPIVLGISGHVTGDWGQAALFSVSVAVGLVPEMLPAIVNANLARGAHLLSKKKAIIKRLDAIQNLGSMRILCSDKTGTLTKDAVVLEHVLGCDGNENSKVFQLAYINALAQGNQGNAMDAAIVKSHEESLSAVTIPYHKEVAVIPFTFERRRSSCVVRGITQTQMLICKGAFEEVLGLSTRIRRGATGEVALDHTTRQNLIAQAQKLASNGYRVLLVASKQVPNFVPSNEADEAEDGEDLTESSVETGMTLEGMITFLDPIKDDAAASVARLRESGVEIKVLTGDNIGVALNICQAINIIDNGERTEAEDDVVAINGPDLAQIEDMTHFDDTVRRCKVFAKLTPSQKGKVVNRLRAMGNCVGMLGDGVNDCVALRAADVGISVDSGSRAAKDSGDVILTEKGLDIICEGVRVGRVTQGNSMKYIKMVASANFGNVFSILIASSWLPFTPMSSVQLLVQNLLYDVSQVAIPWDRMDEEYLVEPKQWRSWDLLRFILVLGPTSSVIDIACFIIGWFYYGVQSADDPQAVSLFQTHWFLQGLLTQTLIVHLLRTAKIPVIQSRASRILVFMTCLIMTIGFCVPYIPPFQSVLSMVRPADTFVGILAALLLAYCIEVQLVKMLYVRIFQAWL